MAIELLYIRTAVLQQIREFLRNGQKINAIKCLRRDRPTGLREAKDAVELLAYDMGVRSDYPENARARIVSRPQVKNLTVDFGEGDIIVDLEAMEMRGLMNLEKIGIDELAELIDVINVLKRYHHGKTLNLDSDDGEGNE